MRLGLFIALCALLFASPLGAVAQSLENIPNGLPFTLSVRPQYPAPFGKATLSPLSNSLNLSNALMVVSVAGREVYRGSAQPVDIALGKAGSVTNVKVTITSAGVPYVQSLFIQPQDVVLVAEPVASTHPLYPGTPLVPLQGSVRVVAVANLKDAGGRAINPEALSYTWTVAGAQIANASGIGKRAILVASPFQYRERSVSVAVRSQDGGLVGGASFSLEAEEPVVRIYRNDPLLGIRFDHALSNEYALSGTETSLYAVPFSLATTNGAPLINWFVDGEPVQTGSSVTLRPSGTGQGSATLSLTASSGNFTPATARLQLSFGAVSNFNLFGL
ncbi:MAG: hypothetical protein G01um101449_134 [Parcubacteria group bacterium Gr01-1014_49]|nr:MAG: hypothetical protein G01um101449_134 [Parcubacteria group bacterium Gr01-1014_49]